MKVRFLMMIWLVLVSLLGCGTNNPATNLPSEVQPSAMLPTSNVSPTVNPDQIIDARLYLDPSLPDAGIETAISQALEQKKSVVQLPAGSFVLERAIELPSGITLQGMGDTTILKGGRNELRMAITQDYEGNSTNTIAVADTSQLHVDQLIYLYAGISLTLEPKAYTIVSINAEAQTITLDAQVDEWLTANESQIGYGLYAKVMQPAKQGSTMLHISDPYSFKPGDGIAIKTWAGMGIYEWGVEYNVVTSIDIKQKTLQLQQPLTLDVAENTIVAHQYPGIIALGDHAHEQDIANIAIKDLVIEGWEGSIKPALYHFLFGGISLVDCRNATLSNVTVRYWHSDAISLQHCTNSTINDSTTLANRGHGFHPGTISRDLEFVRIHAIDNLGYPAYGTAGDGVYYCWDNTNVNIRQSEFRGNAGSGIGDVGGGIDAPESSVDTHLTIEDNLIENNGLAGISITGGGRSDTIIQRNTIRNNNRANADYAEINIAGNSSNAEIYTIRDNRLENSNSAVCGIREQQAQFTSDYNSIQHNTILTGCKVQLVGKHSQESNTITQP